MQYLYKSRLLARPVKAIQITAQQIGERAAVLDLSTTMSPYFERIYKSQRAVAREMTDLGMYPRSARQGEGLHFPRMVTDVPFRITEMGVEIDADGSIIVFLEGFPISVIEQAGGVLEQLAQALYAPLTIR